MLRTHRPRLRRTGRGSSGSPLDAVGAIVLFTGPSPSYVIRVASRMMVVGATYLQEATATAGVSTMTAGPWVLPTLNEDGTAIGTITGQTVYFDTVSRMGTGVAYSNSLAVGDGTSLTKLITGLAANTVYYYALTVTVAGVESNYGMETYGTSSV